ncbi:MAG: MliC family protein [Leptospira sp.]|nr:MliC family protein [Leptospira sp.]
MYKFLIIPFICLCTLLCKSGYEKIEVVYEDRNGRIVNAIYHNPFDFKETFFVTLKFTDGNLITLNQGVAASGVRYTDNKTLVWWTKGDEAFLMKPDGKGDWEITDRFQEVSNR